MLRTNLSTKPFYNVRAVQALLGVLGLIVVAVTLFNIVQGISLSRQQASLGARASDAEAEAARLRGEAARVLAQIDPKELEVVSGAAREANRIIDQRAFSWTQLFAQFETTLPEDVRITAVQPRLEDDNSFVVSMTVEARRVEDLDAFIEALEGQSTFRNVLPVEEQTNDTGMLEAVIEGIYMPPAREPVTPAANTGDRPSGTEPAGAARPELSRGAAQGAPRE
jgi:hypothetical protein